MYFSKIKTTLVMLLYANKVAKKQKINPKVQVSPNSKQLDVHYTLIEYNELLCLI